ncbi:MAG: hypothetical protein SFU87_16705 [Chitinophagaceae bacterium]|nr:hypothetical protein [Chitinophagaceae bacterium]
MQQLFNDTSNTKKESILEEVKIGDEIFYKISDVDAMRPFFMSIVSESNHWLFVSGNGGITAGRKNAEYALFPYYTDDKITESAEITGSKTILRIAINDEEYVWEPFSARSEALYNYQRNIYKNRYSNKIIFEEINNNLSLTFQYEWNSSNLYGFVRKSRVINHSADEISIAMIDGLQNILPYGVGSDLQNSTSNLADAYKRSELLPDTGLGIFALSAIIVDKAEPSEALKANTVWSAGLDNPTYLLSTKQLHRFRKGGSIKQEEDVKGEKGAYFISAKLSLVSGAEKNWFIIANVNQSQSAIIQLADNIRHNINLLKDVLSDVEEGTKHLVKLVAAADGLQFSADELGNTRHYSNTLFNIMRGGIFDDGYNISKNDFVKYFRKANAIAYASNEKHLQPLREQFSVFTLKELAEQSGDADFIRLATEYLPLKFSRRHGDPSRPWNKFTINTRSETDGSKILDYEGNWRDIFQNWEALAHSYPAFIEGMIFKFLNASTFDGYNPYRVMKDGFDWEKIEPDNPWSYIGYWGDHQVIYLLKFLEFAKDRYPYLLKQLLHKEIFVYANVPYKIKSYQQILTNPKDTIEFDHAADKTQKQKMEQLGADGALHTNSSETIHRVNFTEKLLAMLLAKLTNLVPGGGIWMNTQRPEWNDANNALVGNGLSMVTLYYLRRFLVFVKPLFDSKANPAILLSAEVQSYFISVAEIFKNYATSLPAELSNQQKKNMLDELGESSSSFRDNIYANHFSGKKSTITADAISQFIANALAFTEQSIAANKRKDGLYHTYNLLSYNDNQLSISHLDEMLEGQVAVLSSGYLSAEESSQLLDALKNSSLYRPDQDSYILYPNKELPKFLQKNNVPAQSVQSIPLLKELLADGGAGIIEKDILGGYHFNGRLRNANELSEAFEKLDSKYQLSVLQNRTAVLDLFEKVFNHKAFTGRSGTFFAFEGLGSIYWHMVSKLLLAVKETCLTAAQQKTDNDTLHKLYEHFHAIKEGIGVHKSPAVYGAFPTDPYSHTPFGKGAQQPGMTGQVKEDIISRYGELGVQVHHGQLSFNPVLLQQKEFLSAEKQVSIINSKGEKQIITLLKNSLLFTICQVPVVYVINEKQGLEVAYRDGTIREAAAVQLTEEETTNLFNRSGEIISVRIFIQPSNLPEQ